MRERSPLAQKIEALMKEKGLYAAQLARMAGVEKVYLSDLFKGKSNNPRCEKIVKIANALDCSLDYLFSRTPYRHAHRRSPDNVPSGMVRIPQYDLDQEIASDTTELNLEPSKFFWDIPTVELYTFTISPSDLAIFIVRGDSMEPDYLPGERILVDISQKNITHDGNYIIFNGVSLALKKLQINMGNEDNPKVSVISVNKEYAVFTQDMENIKIIGRVVGKWECS